MRLAVRESRERERGRREGVKRGAKGAPADPAARGRERTSNFLGGGVRSMPEGIAGYPVREEVVQTKLNNIDGQRKLKAVKVFSVAVRNGSAA